MVLDVPAGLTVNISFYHGYHSIGCFTMDIEKYAKLDTYDVLKTKKLDIKVIMYKIIQYLLFGHINLYVV